MHTGKCIDFDYSMFDTFEKREKSALEKDPNNPNVSFASSQSNTATFSKSVGAGAARNALKEKIAEQRRAKMAASNKGVPDRPMSAAASYSPPRSGLAKSLGPRTTSTTSTTTSGPARPPSAMSGESTKSALKNSTGTGSLMSGTVRRPMRRPEISRPATADPYAARRAGKETPSMTPEKTPVVTTTIKSAVPKNIPRPRSQNQNSPNVSPVRSKSRIATHRKTPSMSSQRDSPAVSPAKDADVRDARRFSRSQSHHDPGTIPFKQRNGMDKTAIDNDTIDIEDEDNFTMVIPNLARPAAQPTQLTPPKSYSGRLSISSPRSSLLKRPKSIGDINPVILRGNQSPRVRSPDRPSTRGTDAQDEVRVYEDPFVGEEPAIAGNQADKSVLEELPINEKSNERRRSSGSLSNDVMMGGDANEDRPRGHHKTTSTGSIMRAENHETNNAEVLKNRQLLASGIRKIEGRTVEAHMFRRMQDVIKSSQDIWGPNDENFGRLLISSLEYLEAPVENLQMSPMKAVNLKVQALATIRALISLYRKETARYSSRVLCSILQTKAQYENTSHIAIDLETTASEIVKYGQTIDCLNAVLALIEATPTSSSSSSTNSKSSVTLIPTPSFTRTTTMALSTLASLIQVTAQKNIPLNAEQTARLGKLAVRCMDDCDADVRKADVEFCIALHEKIKGSGEEKGDGEEEGGFWRVVAGAREQHLNLLTYYLAKRGKA